LTNVAQQQTYGQTKRDDPQWVQTSTSGSIYIVILQLIVNTQG